MQEQVLALVQKANGILSDYILIFLLVAVGLFFSFKTKFVQVRCFGDGCKRFFGGFSLKGGKQKGGLTSFQALATAIAAQVGTGNIVGASGAILTGGPGAIFWMWIIAFLGMATIYTEAVLAQETKVVNGDDVKGGPVYYIKKAFPNGFGTFLAIFFAVAAMVALGFFGSMVQSNSIAETCNTAFGVAPWIVGAIVAIISLIVFIGGVQRLASFTEKIVPFMALLYLIGGIAIIIARIEYIPATFGAIFKYAFTPDALIGGGIGYALKTAISQGAKRGLFSNEAGMGSTPHAHATAKVDRPHDQGVSAMIGVFIDTFVVLTMTAIIVISCTFVGDGALAGATGATYSELIANAGISKTNVVQMAFSNSLGLANWGNIFVAVCLFFFAFSTILSWNFFGKINAQYLTKNSKIGTALYAIIAVGFIFLGSLLSNDLVWELTDFFNYLMVLPNVIAMFALAKLIKAEK